MPTDTESPAGSGNNQSKFDNYSLDFKQGVSDKIGLTNAITLSYETGYSFSFWVKFNTSVQSGFVWNNSNRGLYYRTANNSFTWYDGANKIFTHPTAFQSNTWYHIVFINDNGSLKFYANTEAATNSGSITSSSNYDFENFAWASGFGGVTYLDGSMSQFCVFDYALSETKIKYLYNNNDTVNPTVANPQNPMAIPGNSPIAYYDLGGSSTGDAGASPNTLTVPNSSVPSATVFQPLGANQIMDLGGSGLWSNILVGTNRTGIATFSSWVKGPIVGYHSIWDLGFSQDLLRTGTNQKLYYRFGSGGIYKRWIMPSGVDLDSSNWLHIVLVFKAGSVTDASGTAAGSGVLDIDLYVNGDLATHDPVPSATGNSANTWGYPDQGIENISNKQLTARSNVQIWNSELTAPQITTLYNNGKPYLGTQPQAASLKGWWRMNIDTSNWDGSNWEIGNSTANYSTALDFDGSSDYINCGADSSLNTNALTVSCWVKCDPFTPSIGPAIISKDTQSGAIRSFGFLFVFSEFLFQNWDSAGNDNRVVIAQPSNPINTDGKWHHLVATIDGTTNTNGIKVYIDNVVVGQVTATATGIRTSTAPFFIGASGSSGTNYNWNGEISNVAIFNTALNSPQVQTLYNNGTPETSISHSPISWWKLDNTNTGIQDSGSASNNGNNNGATQVSSLVSTLNGTTSGMNTANLVNSDLERSIPYSSYSMDFDGTDWMETVAVPTPAITQVSLSAWIKRDGAQTNYNGVLGVRNGTGNAGNGYLICWDLAFDQNSNTIQFRVGDGASAYKLVPSDTAIPDNTWTHVLGVLKGTDVFIYINGVKQSTTNTFTGTLLTPTVKIGIGKQGGSTGNTFNGKISNPAVFDRGLTEDEVATVYNGGVPNDISSLSPINWWSLSGDSYYNGSKWISPDLGSNSNNAESPNLPGTALKGDGPLSEANGVGTDMSIPLSLKGNAPNSNANAFSVNMNFGDKTSDVPVVT